MRCPDRLKGRQFSLGNYDRFKMMGDKAEPALQRTFRQDQNRQNDEEASQGSVVGEK
jgi:hypothetical protein